MPQLFSNSLNAYHVFLVLSLTPLSLVLRDPIISILEVHSTRSRKSVVAPAFQLLDAVERSFIFQILFRIYEEKNPVIDSVSTPDSYTRISQLWKNGLTNDADVTKPFLYNNLNININSGRYEVVIVEDVIKEGDDPMINSSTKRNDIINALNKHSKVMQLKLQNANLYNYSQV